MNSYKDAARAFRRGEIGFDELHQALTELPRPEAKLRATTIEEVYRLADEPPPDNSFTWIASLYHAGHLSKEQLQQLGQAAVDKSG